jgi:hypothetical protein
VTQILMSTFVILVAACVQMPTRVDIARTQGPDKSYTVDLPIGWIKQGSPNNRTLLASRDGFLLEAIAITKQPIKEAFPKTKKAATAQMLPAELAELEIAELKNQDEFTAALTVAENGPAEIAGHDGFDLRVRYRNTRGLEIQQVVYGFVDKASYYQIIFQAPMLYYFNKHYPEFQKVVESFQLTTEPSVAKN